jgi:hypothetical protein
VKRAAEADANADIDLVVLVDHGVKDNLNRSCVYIE